MRVVVDTNLWVSYLLQPNSPSAATLDYLQAEETLLFSHDTLKELGEVLMRPKFAPYLDEEDVRAFITEFVETGEEVKITREIQACRDPKDDKFLELAASGHADYLVTGDADLLALHPFENIPVLTMHDFARSIRRDRD